MQMCTSPDEWPGHGVVMYYSLRKMCSALPRTIGGGELRSLNLSNNHLQVSLLTSISNMVKFRECGSLSQQYQWHNLTKSAVFCPSVWDSTNYNTSPHSPTVALKVIHNVLCGAPLEKNRPSNVNEKTEPIRERRKTKRVQIFWKPDFVLLMAGRIIRFGVI
ncbi:hypothetical protein Taro_007474 [Colocasia esculenta]|uniref:Uncharacterized protein n=1 Tax=Colocasia esculenta TaxID=4460 RepID=A0A843TY86_COLES|nr:hypothetical protein [Colocasia esculenta]